jgi:hypothetical protein
MKLYHDGDLFADEFIEGANILSPSEGMDLDVAPRSNLITNGNAELGTNYNFVNFTYYTADYYTPSGCFYRASNAQFTSTEYIETDINDVYQLRGLFKSVGSGGLSKLYYGIANYDAAKLLIAHQNVHYYNNTITTLASGINNGDTIVYLTSAANWKTAADTAANRHLGVWLPSDGYPDYTYTKRVQAFANSSVVTGTVTLSAPWAQGAIASGSAVANMFSGGTYQYIAASNVTVPSGVWTEYTRLAITGQNNYGGMVDSSTVFRYGTEYVRILFLINYAQDATYQSLADRLIWQNLSHSQSVPQKFGMTSISGCVANEFVEVGPTDGLLGYWKLDGNVLDSTTYHNDGTITGHPVVSSGIIGDCYTFDGENSQGITCGNFPVTASGFTMCAWVNQVAISGTKGIIGNHYHILPCYGSNIYIGTAAFIVAAGDGVGNRPAHSFGTPGFAGQWVHVAATYSGTTASGGVFTAYYNGAQYGTPWSAALVQNNTTWLLGRWAASYATEYVINGSIDDCRVYGRILSPAEIDTLYRLGKGTLVARELLYTETFLNDHYRLYVKKEIKEV